MNALARILTKEAEIATRLGNPSADSGAMHRRMNAMATMTGMNGFRAPPMQPKTDSQGKTRGDRKRAAYVATIAKVSEIREPQFMHSAARWPDPASYAPRPMTGFLAMMQEAA